MHQTISLPNSQISTNQVHSSWQLWPLVTSHALLAFVVFLWFCPWTYPACQAIDNGIFYLLNGSLQENQTMQYIWGMLNHRREVWLNLVFANLINLWAIWLAPKGQKKVRVIQILYFWTIFEIGLKIEDSFFAHYLQLERLSPSLVLEPVIRLSEMLNNRYIVDASRTSFPSGHAFAMVYWAIFTAFIGPRKVSIAAILLASIFTLPRLFSGAHWLSDSIFSALMAAVLFSWAIATPLYGYTINKLSRLFSKRT